MNRTAIVIAIGLALAATRPAAPAQAANARSFVSSTGNDSNNCALATPCRTFVGAFAKTNPSGEIDVLDTAGYGPLTITHAISIVNDGSVASVLVPLAGIGITINAGTTDAVSLRGLTIEGAGVGTDGIQFNTGQSLTIENCVIRHATSDGIDFLPNASSKLLISNSLVADNTSGEGIFVSPSGSGIVTAVFNHVESNNNRDGINVTGASSTGTVTATASESVVAGNSSIGFLAQSTSGAAPTTLTLFHSVATNNGAGIQAVNTNATLTAAGGGVVKSYGDNYFDNNGANMGSLTNISADKQ
jgi:Right handed beta helix region